MKAVPKTKSVIAQTLAPEDLALQLREVKRLIYDLTNPGSDFNQLPIHSRLLQNLTEKTHSTDLRNIAKNLSYETLKQWLADDPAFTVLLSTCALFYGYVGVLPATLEPSIGNMDPNSYTPWNDKGSYTMAQSSSLLFLARTLGREQDIKTLQRYKVNEALPDIIATIPKALRIHINPDLTSDRCDELFTPHTTKLLQDVDKAEKDILSFQGDFPLSAPFAAKGKTTSGSTAIQKSIHLLPINSDNKGEQNTDLEEKQSLSIPK